MVAEVSTLYITGCSFAAGCGLDRPKEDSYGALLAKKMNLTPVNISKHSGSNFSIMCQVLWALKHGAEFILIGSTSVDRLDWIAQGGELKGYPRAPDFNYHGYHPYNETDHPFVGNPRYNPVILSDSIPSIAHVIDNFKEFDKNRKSNKEDYWGRRLKNESKERLDILKSYISEVYDHNLKYVADRSHLLMAVRECERKRISYFVVDSNLDLAEYLDSDRCLPRETVSPIFYDGNYADKHGTMHISEEGHKLIANLIWERMQ